MKDDTDLLDEMAEGSDYEAIVEAIRELEQQFGVIDHFIICPDDARDAELRPQVEDRSGEVYYEVVGYKLYPHEECPPGQLGACVVDRPIGQA